jgi:hypothetical protein
MKGDFTRNTFDQRNHFTRVLLQQGRVQLDADWNEQAAILLHYLQALAADVIGPYGGPSGAFDIKPGKPNDFSILPGHYYVDGLLCENDGEVAFSEQPNYPLPDQYKLPSGRGLVYLDVWERHLTFVEDDLIREVALGGPDTATRAQLIWQAKILGVDKAITGLQSTQKAKKEELANAQKAGDQDASAKLQAEIDKLDTILKSLAAAGADCNALFDALLASEGGSRPDYRLPRLHAQARPGEPSDEACNVAPGSRYRGENQLYRVQIHTAGQAGTATFGWSRENGSVVFPICSLQGNTATLDNLGRDDRLGLQKGDWVEVVDDDLVLLGQLGPLFQVDAVDPVEMQVTLTSRAGLAMPVYDETSTRHPLLRRWDQQADNPSEGTMNVREDVWIDLEQGVQIRFQKSIPAHQYASGDYWLIPARVIAGDVEWPGEPDKEPYTVGHHYAPLAIITVDADGNIAVAASCRRECLPLCGPGK